MLAVLDKKPFELNVESAKAALSRAQARLTEKKSGYERERRIQSQDPGATTQKAVEQARAAYEATRQNVSYSRAQLDLAKRDLAKTELQSPFDGVVSARHIEPFEEVSRGKPVLELFVEGAMEVAVGVPENMIGDVHVGLRGEVRLPNRPDDVYLAVVSKVGSAARRSPSMCGRAGRRSSRCSSRAAPMRPHTSYRCSRSHRACQRPSGTSTSSTPDPRPCARPRWKAGA